MTGLDSRQWSLLSLLSLHAVRTVQRQMTSKRSTDLLVSGKRSADAAMKYARDAGGSAEDPALNAQAESIVAGVRELLQRRGGDETISGIRREMRTTLEDGAGIYRDEAGTALACEKIADLRERYKGIEVNDKSNVFNTDLQSALELRNLLAVAETVTEASLLRRESRGAHQRLDYTERDDENFLKHSLCFQEPEGRPRVEWSEVTITRSQPGTRDYSGGKK